VKLYTYDLSSAYPFHASQLLNLRDCEFYRAQTIDIAAYYGFLQGTITVYPDHPLAYCSPFLADRGDGTLVNFTGTVPNYTCTLDEIRTLLRYGLGEFQPTTSWYIRPLNGVSPRHPFQEMMNDLYIRRGESELKSYILKRVMTGVIGKLLETRKDQDGNIVEYGDSYNPIYHAIITARTRLQVFDFIVQNGIGKKELVHIGVDGIRATKYLPLPRKAPMGKWRCSGSEPTVVLSPGAILTVDRRFKRTDYPDLIAECMARLGASKLGQDADNLIDLRMLWRTQTRVFPKLPKTAGALLGERYYSEPVEMG